MLTTESIKYINGSNHARKKIFLDCLIKAYKEYTQKTIEVVYENGVFKPLEKVEIKKGVKRRIMIEEGHFEKFFGIFKDKEISLIAKRCLNRRYLQTLRDKKNSNFRPRLQKS